MASNWIKVEVITPDKPEIFRLAEILNIDPDAVLGKAIRFWVWADQQTIDGNADNITDNKKCNATSVTNSEQVKRRSHAVVITKSAIDRICFMAGFSDALIQVGWLSEVDGVLVLPNFDRHNGESSKKRALTNKRVSKSRLVNRNGNAGSVTGDEKRNAGSVTGGVTKALPEEEEEEDIKELKDPPNPPKGTGGNKFEPLAAELPEWLSREIWSEWVEFRRQLKKPIKTAKGISESINRLAEYFRQGYLPEQVIRQSIANEWQGLFQPKDGLPGRNGARDVNVISPPDNDIPPGFRG